MIKNGFVYKVTKIRMKPTLVFNFYCIFATQRTTT